MRVTGVLCRTCDCDNTESAKVGGQFSFGKNKATESESDITTISEQPGRSRPR